eukprot:1194681-Prorocentrum_minimum.AAC.1
MGASPTANSLPSAANPPPSVANSLPLAANSPPSAANPPPSAANPPPSAADSPPSAANSPPSAANSPPSAANSPPSAANSPPSAANSPPSAANSPPWTLHSQVEQRPDGVVLRGAKLHQTGCLNSHWLVVMPGQRLTEAEKEYAVACALPVDHPGLTYIYGRQSCDTRVMEPSASDVDQGNAQFGGQVRKGRSEGGLIHRRGG